MSEVGLIAATLPLQSQQEVSPTPDPAPLVLIDHIHEQEGQYSDISVRELSPDDIEHAVERVQAVGVVHSLLGPRFEASVPPGRAGVAAGRTRVPAGPLPAGAARPAR